MNFIFKKLLLLFVFSHLFFWLWAQNLDMKELVDFEKNSASNKMFFSEQSETNTYDILYHRVFWDIDPAEYYIKGAITSYFKTTKNSFSEIYFDVSTALKIDSVTQNGALLNYSQFNNLLKIDLPDTLEINTTDSLTVYYQGAPEASTGFTSFDTASHNGVPSLWTLSEPYGAREWWPCKHSLSDKIDSIDIIIKTPLDNKAGSNGKLISELTFTDYKLFHWRHRYPIAAYLVAIAVTNYEAYSQYAKVDDNNTVEILNYVYPEYLAETKVKTAYTVRVMELFSKLFIPYPFYDEKYGHAQFMWGGGMEHQTMSFMGGFSEHLITHELAHQWFGDYVTCGSWKDIWINEGFAVFCEGLAQEHLHNENWINWKANEIDLVLHNAQEGSIYVNDTSNVRRIFDYFLSYKKGGLILQLLRSQIGDDAFFKAVKELLTNNKTAKGFASGDDFKQFAEQSADTSLTQFFDDWYYGQGYPTYSITWMQDLNNNLLLTLSQTTTHSSVPFFALRVPILLKGQGKEQLVYFHNTHNNQDFNYTTNFIVEEVVFDPNYDIIAPHPATVNLKISETDSIDGIDIMPNPTKKVIQVKAQRDNSFDRIEIINISGKLFYEESFNQLTKKAEIDLSSFPVGIYFIRIDSNKGIITKEFVKSN